MGTGYKGAFMVPWAQTLLEGSPAEPETELAEGMSWSWHGRALALHGDHAAFALTASRDQDELRSRAARVVRKLLQRPATCPADLAEEDVAADDSDPVFSGAFVVADGTTFFTVVPVVAEDGAHPVLLFPHGLPRPGRRHTIVACSHARPTRAPSERPAVICFTPGTRLRTVRGDIPVENVGPGDRVLTLDDGPQEVLWTGHRRMSGARLFALPAQRPVRLGAGALGPDRPDGDLVVSPEHRLLVSGPAPRALWGVREVLVRAGDLIGTSGVSVDHSLRETVYIHLMLARHEVIWANGLQVESLHPGFMGLETLSEDQREAMLALRPDLAEDPFSYGAPARRMLSRAEAAILTAGPAAPLRVA